MSDDDVTLAAALMIASSTTRIEKKPRRKRRWWSITLYKKRDEYGLDAIMRDLRTEPDSGKLHNFLRMTDADFCYLLDCLTPLIKKEDTHLRKAITPSQRFLITLRFLATGESFESLSYIARVSPHAISYIVMDVCTALINLLADQMQMPDTPDGWKQIALKFQEETHFPHCIGALDGRHMVIQNPIHAGSTFFNYKGTFSIVLMGLCDSNYCFTYANVGAQGRISDGGVFNACSLATKLENNTLHLPPPEPLAPGRECTPYVIVADNAFGLKKNIMVPHSLTTSAQLNSEERIFNYRLSAARSRIENTFGIMAAVFRIFQKPIFLAPEKARTIVECCVLLHNFLRRSRTSKTTYTPPGTFDSHNKEDGAWRQDSQNMTSCLPLTHPGRRSCTRAKSIRTEFGKFFLTDTGMVPWQYNLQ